MKYYFIKVNNQTYGLNYKGEHVICIFNSKTLVKQFCKIRNIQKCEVFEILDINQYTIRYPLNKIIVLTKFINKRAVFNELQIS